MDEEESEDTDDEYYLTRDEFNLHKMIVVVTEIGKVIYDSLGFDLLCHFEPLLLWMHFMTASVLGIS